jgi:hypothetical protein
MMADPTKGSAVSYEEESTFGTDPNSDPHHIRIEGEPEIESPAQLFQPVNTLMTHAYDGEPPVTYSQYVDDAIKFKCALRRAVVDGEDSFLVSAFKSGGYTVTKAASDTTISSYGGTLSWTLTADNSGVGYGMGVTLNDGRVIPVLVFDYSAGDVIPSQPLPAASSNGKAVLAAETITPGSPIEVATTLSMRHLTRADTSADLFYGESTGVSLSSVGDLVIERGTIPFLDLSFRAASHGYDTDLASLPANNFRDTESLQVADDFLVYYGAGWQKLIRATVSFGAVTEPIIGQGAETGNVGGIQGHMQTPNDTGFTVELELLFDEANLSNWDGSNTAKELSIIQPGTADNPGWGMYWPVTEIIEQPTVDNYSNSYHTMTFKVRAYPAGFDGTTDSAQGNQCFYLILPTESA